MKKILVFILAVMLLAAMAIPAYAVTPKFEYKAVKIPEIKVETNFAQNIVSNWFKEHPLDIQFDFSGIKLW